MMSIFQFLFRNPTEVQKRTGLVGHWKETEGGNKEDLRELIEQIRDGDKVTVIFTGDRNHAARTMFDLKKKLCINTKESLSVMLQGILRRHPDIGKEHTIFGATANLSGITKYRRASQERLFEKLNGHLTELRVFRGEEDPE